MFSHDYFVGWMEKLLQRFVCRVYRIGCHLIVIELACPKAVDVVAAVLEVSDLTVERECDTATIKGTLYEMHVQLGPNVWEYS